MKEKYIKFLKDSIIREIEATNDFKFLQIIFDLLMKNACSK